MFSFFKLSIIRTILAILLMLGFLFIFMVLWKDSLQQELTPKKYLFAIFATFVLVGLFLMIWFKHNLAEFLLVLMLPSFQFYRYFINTEKPIMIPENIFFFFLLAAFLQGQKSGLKWFSSQYQRLFFIFAFLAFLSIINVPLERHWQLFYIGYLLPFIFILLFQEWLRNHFNLLLLSLLLSVTVPCFLSVYFTIQSSLDLGSLSKSIFIVRGVLSNALVGWIVIVLPLALVLLKLFKNFKIRALLALSIGAMIFSLFTSLSRGIIILIPLIVLMLLFFRIIPLKIFIVFGLITFFALSAINYYDMLLARFNTSPQFNFFLSGDIRIELISTYWDMIKASPFLGVGLGNFYGSPLSSRIPVIYNSPNHNLFSYIAAETGMPSLLVFLWMIFVFFKQSVKCMKFDKEKSGALLSKALFVGMVSFLLFANSTGAILLEENFKMSSATGTYLLLSIMLVQDELFKRMSHGATILKTVKQTRAYFLYFKSKG
jgi:O-antigen ligase